MDGPSKTSDHDLSDLIEELLTGGRDPLGKAERLMRIASDVLANPPQIDAAPGAATGKGFIETFAQVISRALQKPELLAEHFSDFAGQAIDILRQSDKIDLEPSPRDRRFRDPLGRESPVLRGLMQLYLSWNEHVQGWLDAQEIGDADRLRILVWISMSSAHRRPRLCGCAWNSRHKVGDVHALPKVNRLL